MCLKNAPKKAEISHLFCSYNPTMTPATSANIPPQPTPNVVAPPVFIGLVLTPVAVLICVLVVVVVPPTLVVLVSVLVEAPVFAADEPV